MIDIYFSPFTPGKLIIALHTIFEIFQFDNCPTVETPP